VKLEIMDQSADRVAFSLDLDVGFTAGIEGLGHSVLGREGFFGQFRITFDHSHRWFEIEA